MNRTNRLLAAYFWMVVAFLFIPIIVVFILSFSEASTLAFPPRSFGVRWYVEYFTNPVWIEATLRSIRVAVLSSMVATVCGTLISIGIFRIKNNTLTRIMSSASAAPLIVPSVIIALGIFMVAAKSGLFGTELVLVFGHAVVSIPFVVLIVNGGLTQVDLTLERAARIMGAGPYRAFTSVVLPFLLPSIVAAAIVACFTSFDELIIALFVMGEHVTLPVRIWSDLRFELNPIVASISTLLVFLAAAAMWVAERLRRFNAPKMDVVSSS